MTELFGRHRIDQHEPFHVLRKAVRVDANDIRPERVAYEHGGERHLEAVDQPMKVVGVATERACTSRRRAPAESSTVVTPRLGARSELALHAAPVETRGGEPGFEDHGRPVLADLNGVKAVKDTSEWWITPAVAAHTRQLHTCRTDHRRHEECDRQHRRAVRRQIAPALLQWLWNASGSPCDTSSSSAIRTRLRSRQVSMCVRSSSRNRRAPDTAVS